MLQASSREASSVQISGPSAGKRRYASRRRPRRTPCGVWAAASPSRSTVPVMTPSSTRLRVSATGTTGMAAPYRAVASATDATSAADHERPRGVMDKDDAAIVRPVALERREPGSDRLLPAVSASHDVGDDVREPGGARELGGAFGCGHDHDATDRRARPRRAASVQARSGRPAISISSLSAPPIRAERPAATTMTSASPAGAPPLNRAAAARRSSAPRPSGGLG